MAPSDVIKVKCRFSLPYKPGMEQEPGFVAKADNVVLAVFSPDKQTVAKFEVETAKTLADWLTFLTLTQEQAAIAGVEVKGQNKTRNLPLQALCQKYSLKTLTGAGGLGKRAIAQMQDFYTSALAMGQPSDKVYAFMAKKHSMTVEQLKEVDVK